jgi:hypothetical protein
MQFFASELQGSKAMSEPNAEAIHSTFVKNVKAAGLVSKVENMLLIRVFRQGEGQMNRQIELEMRAIFAGMTLVIHQVNFEEYERPRPTPNEVVRVSLGYRSTGN